MTTRDEFWMKVRKTRQCWLWTGGTQRGYGAVLFDGKHQRAHRVSFEWAFGPIPPGSFVLHRCDTRACVRPDHLFAGTQGDNMRDMARKGRHGWQTCPERMGCKHHPPESVPRGERHANAKMTASSIRAIRELHMAGQSQDSLAAQFHLGQTTVSRIVRRKAWRHVV